MQKPRAYPGRVIFDHLPKTAGQAVNSWLVKELGSGTVSPNLIGAHRDLIRTKGGIHSIISAHIQYQNAEGLDPRYQYMTCFRHPVDRVLSWLYFVVNNHEEDKLPDLIPMVRRFLQSDGADLPEQLVGYISNLYVQHFAGVYGTGTEPDGQLLNNSLKAIQEYDVVGLYDNFPGFLNDVATLIGLPPPETIARVNVTKNRPPEETTSTGLRSVITSLNTLDIALFEEVKRLKASAETAKSPSQPEPLPQAVKTYGSKNKHKRPLPAAPEPEPVAAPYTAWIPYELSSENKLITPDFGLSKSAVRHKTQYETGELITFDLDIVLRRPLKNLEAGIHIFDENGTWAFGTNNSLLDVPLQNIRPGLYRISHHIIANLPYGKYTAGFAFAEKSELGNSELYWAKANCDFRILAPSGKRFAGYVCLPASFSLSPRNPENHSKQPVGTAPLA